MQAQRGRRRHDAADSLGEQLSHIRQRSPLTAHHHARRAVRTRVKRRHHLTPQRIKGTIADSLGIRCFTQGEPRTRQVTPDRREMLRQGVPVPQVARTYVHSCERIGPHLELDADHVPGGVTVGVQGERGPVIGTRLQALGVDPR